MNRMLRWGLAALLILSMALPAMAQESMEDAGVDVDLWGYYRVRYDNTFNLGWRFDEENEDGDYNEDSDWWSYFDQRALLMPSVRVNEKIALKAQIDALRNVHFGQNALATIPQVQVERNPADTEQIESVQFDAEQLNRGNIFSASTSTNASVENGTAAPGDAVDSIEISRLWAEVILPFGFFRFGRMGSNFGMGVFSNDGNPRKNELGQWEGLDKNYGDTYDRILFGTRIGGHYIPALFYDRVLEGDFKTGDKDVHQYGFVQYVRDITFGANNKFDAGLYTVHRTQKSTDARVFVYDLWLKLQLGGLTFENEALAVQGSFTQVDDEVIKDLEESGLPTGAGGGKIEVDAYIEAMKLHYDTRTWGTGFDFGFSSPADPDPEREFDPAAASQVAVAAAKQEADPDSPQTSIDFINTVVDNQAAFGTKVFTFPFDPDYDVDLIIWETLMGGAVKNGAFLKYSAYLNPLEEFRLQFDLIKSWINEPGKGQDGEDASHDLGWELDVDVSSTIYNNFFTGVQFGYAWVGPWFEDKYDNVDNIFTMQMRAGITF
ncbi:hypothetical protein KDL45_09450 [bacterium]|nr:hypothetical protein [bacterium]